MTSLPNEYKPKVKICGMTNLEDALFCAHAGADALGFIFYEQSPRYVSTSRAADIIRELPAYVIPVGVFVNEARDDIRRVTEKTGIRIIQLSGDEKPKECLGYGVKVWKAFRIRDLEEVESIGAYSIAAAMLDGAPEGKFGGSGVLPDYSVACAMKEIHPVVLAGGLNPENIIGAIQAVQPYAIDLSSGVEVYPGKKDHSKVQNLFEKIGRIG